MARALVIVALILNAAIVILYATDEPATALVAAPIAALPLPLLWMRRGFRPLAAGLGIFYLALTALLFVLVLPPTGVVLLLASIAPERTLFIGRDALCRRAPRPRR